MRDVAVALLLGLGVTALAVSALGVLVMRDALDRLHFTAPASTVSPVCFAAAVLVEEPLSSSGVKAILVAALIVLTTPVLSHATARAARIREAGRWIVHADEREGSGERR